MINTGLFLTIKFTCYQKEFNNMRIFSSISFHVYIFLHIFLHSTRISRHLFLCCMKQLTSVFAFTNLSFAINLSRKNRESELRAVVKQCRKRSLLLLRRCSCCCRTFFSLVWGTWCAWRTEQNMKIWRHLVSRIQTKTKQKLRLWTKHAFCDVVILRHNVRVN